MMLHARERDSQIFPSTLSLGTFKMDSASMAASPSAPKFGPTADGEITMSSDSKWGKSRESRDKSRVAGNQQSKGGRGSQTSRRRRKDKGRAEWRYPLPILASSIWTN